MREISTAILLLFFCFAVTAQEQEIIDSLVFANEIKFHSELEKEVIQETLHYNQIDYIKLFFAKDSSITKEEYLNEYKALKDYISILRNDKHYTKPEKRKLKYYYNKIHNKYLIKYELNTFFPQIFRNGYYNCVTGTILFCLIFDELDIPYTIKVSPVHSYIVAYPNTKSIIVETTNPVKGYFSFNQAFKENYVNHLRDSKLITNEEYNTNSVNALFDKYYFKEKDITLYEMVGVQYYNDAVYKMQEQNFDEAYFNLEKAYLFYPSKDIEYQLYFTATYLLYKQDYSDLKYVDLLYKLARFKKFGINNEQIVSEFSRITQNQLIYKGNYDLYDRIFKKLYNNLNEPDAKNEIAFIYNYEKAKLYLRNEKVRIALPFLEEALNIRSDHLDLQTLFVYALSSKYRSNALTAKQLDELTSYGKKYPSLKENKVYTDLICDAYLVLAVQSYGNGSLNEALKYHNKFLDMHVNSDSYTNYDINVSRLYSAAAVYYFRIGHMKKSRSAIQKGLQLVPDSYELKERLKAFN